MTVVNCDAQWTSHPFGPYLSIMPQLPKVYKNNHTSMYDEFVFSQISGNTITETLLHLAVSYVVMKPILPICCCRLWSVRICNVMTMGNYVMVNFKIDKLQTTPCSTLSEQKNNFTFINLFSDFLKKNSWLWKNFSPYWNKMCEDTYQLSTFGVVVLLGKIIRCVRIIISRPGWCIQWQKYLLFK